MESGFFHSRNVREFQRAIEGDEAIDPQGSRNSDGQPEEK
jgi:hypothetical protein